MKQNVILEKSKAFGVRITNLHHYLEKEKKEYTISKQIYKSGTSIGANISEAVKAENKKDFIHKMQIAYKEAGETEYWLETLRKSDFLNEKEYVSINNDCVEILKLLTSIIKSTKKNISNL